MGYGWSWSPILSTAYPSKCAHCFGGRTDWETWEVKGGSFPPYSAVNLSFHNVCPWTCTSWLTSAPLRKREGREPTNKGDWILCAQLLLDPSNSHHLSTLPHLVFPLPAPSPPLPYLGQKLVLWQCCILCQNVQNDCHQSALELTATLIMALCDSPTLNRIGLYRNHFILEGLVKFWHIPKGDTELL